jgi:hypothetical protein
VAVVDHRSKAIEAVADAVVVLPSRVAEEVVAADPQGVAAAEEAVVAVVIATRCGTDSD